MAFSVSTALDRIVTIQSGLAITSPTASAIAHAYKRPPPPRNALDFPCFMNSTEKTRHARGMIRERIFLVRMQLLVREVDWDQAGDIAWAFEKQLSIALDNDLTLSIAGVPSCTLWRDLRGGDRTLTWNGIDYPGLDLTMEVLFGGEVPGT